MRKLTTLVTLLLVALLSFSLTGCGKQKNVNDPDRLESELKREISRSESYKAEKERLEEENAELLAKIDLLTSDIIKLNQQIGTITSNSTDQQTINNLNKQVADLKKQLEDAYNRPATSQIGNSTSAYQQTIDSLNAQIADLKKQLEDARLSTSASYPELQNKINALNLDLQNYKQLVETLQKQLADQIASNSQNSSTASTSYLTMKFWSDGNTYSANVTWYTDPNCTTLASNVTITSPVVSTDKLSNGYTVYTCMSSNGLVYSSKYPYLIREKTK